MRKVFILCILLVSFAMAAKKNVAVFPCFGNLNDKELAKLRFKIEEIGINVLSQSDNFKFLPHAKLDEKIDLKKVHTACSEGGTCLKEQTAVANADYGTWCQIDKADGKLTLFFQLFDNIEDDNLYTKTFDDLKNVAEVLKIIDREVPIAFKRMLPKQQAAATPPPIATVDSTTLKTQQMMLQQMQEMQQMQQKMMEGQSKGQQPAQQYTPPPAPKYVSPEERAAMEAAERRRAEERRAEESVVSLLKDGLRKNKDEIKEKSLDLSSYSRESLYDEYEKGAWGWFFLNYLTMGTGIGSYFQGNIKAGVAQTILWGSGIVLFVKKQEKGGGICIATAELVGFIAPFVYRSGYNKDLREALNIGDVSYSIEPLIIPRDGMPAVGLAFNGRF